MYGVAQEFQKPALETLRASGEQIPGIYEKQRATIEAEKEPLTTRYQSLLKDIQAGATKAMGATFTRRGLPLSSGMFESAVAEKTRPEIERIGLEREASLRGLTGLQTGLSTAQSQQELDLARAISVIQSQTGQTGISAGLSQYATETQRRQSEASLALQRWQSEQQLSETALGREFTEQQASWQQPWSEKLWQYQLDEPYYKPTQTLGEGITPFPD